MYKRILEEINKSDNIRIYRHKRPDWDALGSQFGLYEILKENFPNKKISVYGDFIVGNSIFPRMRSEYLNNEYTLGFILDTNNLKLVSDQSYKDCDTLIQIDHHVNMDAICDISYVDVNFESNCSHIYHMFKELGMKISPQAATYLLAGIVTDSGRFKYPSVSSDTFCRVNELINIGGDYNNVISNLYIEDEETVKLKGYFMNHFVNTKKGLAYMVNKRDIFDRFNVDVNKVSRGMVNSMAGIKGIEVWVNFTEDIEEGGILVEIRSRQLPVDHIARKYGGGGHALACGATLYSWKQVDEVIIDLLEIIEVK